VNATPWASRKPIGCYRGEVGATLRYVDRDPSALVRTRVCRKAYQARVEARGVG